MFFFLFYLFIFLVFFFFFQAEDGIRDLTVTGVQTCALPICDGTTRAGTSRDLPQEALMLTGDENIVDINFTVFWIIKDAQSYLFNIRNPEGTVKSAAESAMREIVGETPIAQALSEGRGKIEAETQRLLQGILDTYGSGI